MAPQYATPKLLSLNKPQEPPRILDKALYIWGPIHLGRGAYQPHDPATAYKDDVRVVYGVGFRTLHPQTVNSETRSS